MNFFNHKTYKNFLMLGVAISAFHLDISNAVAQPNDMPLNIGWNKVASDLTQNKNSSSGTDYVVSAGKYLYLTSTTDTKNITVESGAGFRIEDSLKKPFNHIVFEKDSYYYLPTVIGVEILDVYDEKATDMVASGDLTVKENSDGSFAINGYEDKYSVIKNTDDEYVVYRKGVIEGTISGKEKASNILITDSSTLFANGTNPTLTDIEVLSGGILAATKASTVTNLILHSGAGLAVKSKSATDHTIILGDLVLDKDAVIYKTATSGNNNYPSLNNSDKYFNLTGDITNLTLVGGVNEYFNGTGKITTNAAQEGEAEKTLTFAASENATKENPTVWDLGTITMEGWNNSVAAQNTDVYATNVNNFTVSKDAKLTLGSEDAGGYGENLTAQSGSKIVITAGSTLTGLNIEDGAFYDITLDKNSSFDETSVIHGKTGSFSQGNNVDNFVVTAGNTLRIVDNGTLSNSGIYGSVTLTDTTASANTVYDGGIFSINGGTISDITLKNGADFTISSSTAVADGSTWEIEAEANLNNSVTSDIVSKIDTLVLTGGLHTDLKDYLASGNNLIINNAADNVDGSQMTDWSTITVNNVAFDNHTAKSGETLTADENSTLSNLALEDGSVLDAADATFAGTLIVNKNATLKGEGYENIGQGLTELTLIGGLNTAFDNGLNANGAILNLNDGEYTLGGNVSGWQTINANSNVKQTGDISLATGGSLLIADNTNWDFSGNSPFVGTISGDITNNGTMTAFDNLHAQTPNADDVLTITGNYTAGTSAQLDLDVDAEQDTADKFVVNGTITGSTTMNLAFVSEGDSQGAIQVVENDTALSSGDFVLGTIYGSPFEWQLEKQDNGWYIDHERKGVISVTPETGGYISLLGAAFEQTRDLTRNVRSKMYSDYCDGKNPSCAIDPTKVAPRLWVAPVYSYAKIERPLEFDANITGLDAGFDFSPSRAHRIGMLVSYRHGDYDFNGKGEKVKLSEKADVKIDSWLSGLYYGFNNGGLQFNSMLYVGKQKAEISGKGVKSDGNAFESGLGLELGYSLYTSDNFTITPSLSMEHTIISYEDLKDNAGKTAEYDVAYQGELDFGVKFEKDYWLDNEHKTSWYVKPSFVQTFVAGGDVVVTGLDSIESLNDETLLRLRAGGYYDLQNGLVINAEGAYTANSKYKNMSVNLGLRYEF